MSPRSSTASTSSSVLNSSYSPVFQLYDGADLVVKTSDEILFATRALCLRAVSSVFDDILGLPSSDTGKKDGLSLIKIEETGEVFEVFLRYAHRDRLFVEGKGPEPTWKQILLLSTFFDKYDTPNLTRTILLEQLPCFMGDPKTFDPPERLQGTPSILPVEVFAIASIHKIESLCRRALRCSHTWGVLEAGAKSMSHRQKDDPRACILWSGGLLASETSTSTSSLECPSLRSISSRLFTQRF